MSRWPQDNSRALKAFYGDPAANEVERQLIQVVPPFRMTYEGKPIKYISFHKKAAPALLAALNQIWEAYDRDQKKVDAAGVSKFGGSYNKRLIRGSKTTWSNHAYGAAIDLAVDTNGLGTKGDMPLEVIAAFRAQGAKWGGDYKGRKDPMHFEFVDNGYQVASLYDVGQADSDVADGEQDAPETAVVTAAAPPETKAEEIKTSAESDAETRTSWIVRKWRGLLSWASGLSGFGFLAYLTDWRVVVAIGSVTFVFVIVLGVGFIWFMGPGEVRAWIRKQVS